VEPKPRILIADDEHAITALMADMLTHAGFEVIRAHGGAEALTLARSEKPNVVLLDVMMPDLDGRDACRALKMDEELQKVPVVLFSSADEQDVHWRGAAADAFLQKPFVIRALPDFVRSLLGNRS
jgi:DNA-binding response OmpR family regulator